MENKTLHELAKENPDKTYTELTKMQKNSRLKQEVPVIKKDHKEIDYHRYWKDMYEKEHKLKQEVEGELTIVKTITIDSSPEMKDAKKEITKLKKEICELRQDNRRLAHEVEDKVNRMRKSGF
jgi:hypothetical protein